MKPVIAITRPLKDAQTLIRDIQTQGGETLLSPLIDIIDYDVSLHYDALLQADYLVVSSANIVIALQSYGKDKLKALYSKVVFAIGPMSAQAMRLIGFDNIFVACSSMSSLVDRIVGWYENHVYQTNDSENDKIDRAKAKGVYISGYHISADLCLLLKNKGYVCKRYVFYEARAVSMLPEALYTSLSHASLDGIVLYSSRTARIFFTCAQQQDVHKNLSQLRYFCLSQNIAESVFECGKIMQCFMKYVYSAHQPNDNAMVHLIQKQLLHNNSPVINDKL